MTLSTSLIVLPLIGALAVFLLPARQLWVGLLALVLAGAEIVLWVRALLNFDFSSANATLQLEDQHTWFSDAFGLQASYHVGFYSFSLWLVGLTAVGLTAAIAYAVWSGRERPNAYYALMLFLLAATTTVFLAQDMLLFYVAFEAMLIPLYLLVGIWGGAGRQAATFKLIVYTMAGSLLMLASVIGFAFTQANCHSDSVCFDMTGAAPSDNVWIFLGFVAAFAVKAPLFPLHGWLPSSYREASPEVAGVLSGIISKAAAFGFLRIVLPFFPEPVSDWRTVILVFASIGLIYGSFLAFRAPDFRGVIAYSSLAQMSLITIGLFSGNNFGLTGAVLMMVVHGLISLTMFLTAGGVEESTSTGELSKLGGMARGRPLLATVLMTAGMIALAVPGSSAFAGEFLILTGAFDRGWGWAVVGLAAIVLAAMYALRLISAVLHREVGSAVTEEARDLRWQQLGFLVPLLGLLLALSVWPSAITQRSFACVPDGQAAALAEGMFGIDCNQPVEEIVSTVDSRLEGQGAP